MQSKFGKMKGEKGIIDVYVKLNPYLTQQELNRKYQKNNQEIVVALFHKWR